MLKCEELSLKLDEIYNKIAYLKDNARTREDFDKLYKLQAEKENIRIAQNMQYRLEQQEA